MGTHRMRDLVKATGATARVARFYIQEGLLPKATGRGTGPVYTDEHVTLLRVLRSFRKEHLTVAQMKARLAKMSPEDLARLGAPPPPPTPPLPTPPLATSPAPYPAERWDRVPLLPGLELHLRADTGPLLRRIAAEIHARYAAAAPTPEPTD